MLLSRMNPRKLYVLVTLGTLFVNLSALASVIQPVTAQGMWSDTFADASRIAYSNNVTLETVKFGEDFNRYGGNPLLSIRTCDPWDGTLIPGAIHPSVLYFPGGMDGYEYWMVYSPYSAPMTNRDWTWERPTLVRSHDGINWVKTSDYKNPLISPGLPGEWDDDYLADPDIVYTPDKGWFLYYAGASPQFIGVATSPDGKHWTKYAGNPIVYQAVPGGPSVWTRTPCVVYDGATFHMWYNIGSDNIGYANSTNGLNWSLYAGNPALSPTPGSWDSASITHQDVIYYDGIYWMYYVAGSTDYTTALKIGLATSADRIHWTKYSGNPIIAMGTDEWERGCLYHPSPIVVGGEMWLYYSGTNTNVVTGGTVYEIGLAKSKGDGYILLEKEVQATEYRARPENTIAWYHLNEGSSPGSTEYSLTPNTLAWYHFNEGFGTTAADSSGNGNNGALEGGVIWMTGGKIGNALDFDGSTGYVRVPNQPILNPTTEITIETWIFPDVMRANNYIASKYGGTSDSSYGFKVGYGADNKIHGWVSHGRKLYEAIASFQVPVNQWSHVAMTYSTRDSSHAIRLYYNGKEITSYDRRDVVPSDYAIDTSTVDVLVGKLPVVSPERYLDGKLDEFRIVGRALSASEIAADASSSPSPDVLDSSGNGHDGWTKGGATWTSGKFSFGLDFDGSTGYVYLPYSPGMNTASELTIEAWINPDVVKDNNYILSRGNQTSGSYGFKVGYQLDNKIHGWIKHGGTIYQSIASVGVPASAWSFVAMTYSSTEKKIKLYYNGMEVSYDKQDMVTGDGTIDSSNFDMLLGKYIHTSATVKYLNGKLDEIRVLNRTLSPSEVAADYAYRYKVSGNLTSTVITPGLTLGRFYAVDQCPAGTSIEYSILNEAGAVLRPSVISGADISSLGSTPIRLHAKLTTSDPSSTPILHEWDVTYQTQAPPNTPPVAGNLTISPSSPYTTDNLVGSYDYYDADGDPENKSLTEIVWYKNGVRQPEYDNKLTVLSASTEPGEVWYFTVRSSDGKIFGNLQTSPSVTIRPPPIVDTTPPTYSNIGTNTTLAGQSCLFFAKWTDNMGLSGYIFTTNNTGTWVNNTWTSLAGLSGWSNITKILNSMAGIRVRYRFYCNDTSNNWSLTPIQSLMTTQRPTVYFSISSNSTVSSLTFNSTAREIAFDVTGPTGTTGYVDILLSKNLVPDITELRIYVDGVSKSYEAISVNDIWSLHVTYSHSTHNIRVVLSLAISPHASYEPVTTLTIGGVTVLNVALMSLALSRKKKIKKKFTTAAHLFLKVMDKIFITLDLALHSALLYASRILVGP